MLSAESTTKAWQLRDRVSDREKFFIDFTYDRQVTGNLEKAYQTLELWLQTYPRGDRDPKPRSLLGGLSTHGTGRFERAIEASQKQSRLIPTLRLGMAILRPAISSWTDSTKPSARFNEPPSASWRMPDFLVIRYNIAVLQGDQDQMDRAVALARGKPRTEHWMAHAEALALARSGRLQTARRVIEPRHGSGPARGGTRGGRELPGRTSGVGSRVRECCRSEKRTPWRRWRFRTAGMSNTPPALALALSGDSSRSQPLADDLEKRFPEDTFAKFTYVPVLRALSALEEGQADRQRGAAAHRSAL